MQRNTKTVEVFDYYQATPKQRAELTTQLQREGYLEAPQRLTLAQWLTIANPIQVYGVVCMTLIAGSLFWLAVRPQPQPPAPVIQAPAPAPIIIPPAPVPPAPPVNEQCFLFCF